jgi:anti-sigma-K factor RskA
MRLKSPIAASAAAWLGKGFVRFLLLVTAAAAVAAFAAGFGIAQTDRRHNISH